MPVGSHKLERSIVWFSMCVQACLTATVVGFSAFELSRCPILLPSDSGTSPDAAANLCPRALYTNLIVSSVSLWFPAPWSALVTVASNIESKEQQERQQQPQRRSTRRRKTEEDKES